MTRRLPGLSPTWPEPVVTLLGVAWLFLAVANIVALEIPGLVKALIYVTLALVLLYASEDHSDNKDT